MSNNKTKANAKDLIAKTFLDLANALETGSFLQKPRIIVTGIGSEHGEGNLIAGAIAAANDADIIYIGTATHPVVKTVKATCENEVVSAMESLLVSGEADGAVTMHYPFPIGVSTVGRAITPAFGKEVFIATTTGTSSTDRIEGMILNTIYGIIAAKACGNPAPTVGVLNIEGARQVEGALKELSQGGYKINFGSSGRADGGCVLRGNDILTGSCDIAVTDPLTGNILIKMLSSFTTGGGYESVGFGYGPGIGKGYDKLIMIVSRASGAPVVAGAARYAAQLVRGDYKAVARAEFEAAEKAGLAAILKKYKAKAPVADAGADVKAPPKEIVTAQISGVEITELEDAVIQLWKKNIYAESGMGCTGPIILVSENNLKTAVKILTECGLLHE